MAVRRVPPDSTLLGCSRLELTGSSLILEPIEFSAAERRKLSFHALLYGRPFLNVGREIGVAPACWRVESHQVHQRGIKRTKTFSRSSFYCIRKPRDSRVVGKRLTGEQKPPKVENGKDLPVKSNNHKRRNIYAKQRIDTFSLAQKRRNCKWNAKKCREKRKKKDY